MGTNGNQVTMTLDPPAEAGQTVDVQYQSALTTAASRVQDRAGNMAAGFTTGSIPVRNVTIEGPGVDDIAFAGAAQTYAIGDVIGVDVTFNESVTVTSTSTTKPRTLLVWLFSALDRVRPSRTQPQSVSLFGPGGPVP